MFDSCSGQKKPQNVGVGAFRMGGRATGGDLLVASEPHKNAWRDLSLSVALMDEPWSHKRQHFPTAHLGADPPGPPLQCYVPA